MDAVSDIGAKVTQLPDSLERYARQLILPEIGNAGQKRLADARVLIVGAGGLGAPAALYLTAAGVGQIDLIDFDCVDLSNLHRQILFATDDVGRPKAEVAQQRLGTLNPGVRVRGLREKFDAENAMAMVAGHDLVIDASDNFRTRYILNDACVLSGIPYVYSSIFRYEGLLTTFAAPGAPCYRCLYPDAPPDHLVPSCADGGVLGVLPGTMGLLQATEALKLLLGLGRTLAGRLIRYDALNLTLEEFEIARDPQCPICSPHGAGRIIVQPEEVEIRTIADEELVRAMRRGDDLYIVDVRNADEDRTVSVPGSRLIPLDQVERRIEEFPRDRRIILYCRSGGRSAHAARLLLANGFENVFSLEGGMMTYNG